MTPIALARWFAPPLAGALLATIAATGCTSTTAPGPDAGPPTDLGEVVDLRQQDQVSVEMADNVYAPRAIEVDPGTAVTFHNEGANVHDATPTLDGTFPAVTVSPSESATVTVPTEPGTYRFYCSLHASAGSGLQRGAFVVR